MVYADCQEMNTSFPQNVSLHKVYRKGDMKRYALCCYFFFWGSSRGGEEEISNLSLFIWMLPFLSLPLLAEPHHISSHLITPLSLNDIPPRIAQTMENEDSWDFDIFNLEAATMKRWGNNTVKGYQRDCV